MYKLIKILFPVPTSIDQSKLEHYPTVIVNQSKTLECQALGIPTPRITWYKNSEPLQLSDLMHVRLRQEGRRLEILSAKVTDTGLYECRAENEAGNDQVQYELTVFGMYVYMNTLFSLENNIFWWKKLIFFL